MNQTQQVLVSFNGSQDPLSKRQDDGPILSLLKEKKTFGKVVLFHTVDMREQAGKTGRIIQERHPRILVEVRLLNIADPTRYADILSALRPALSECCPADRSTEYYISVSSGTSQMHACWLLLAASGEISARIVHVRERQFVGEGQGLITEIFPRSPEFPDVIPRIRMEEVREVTAAEMEQAIKDAGIIGQAPALLEAMEDAGRTAQYDKTPILILGETGTGKELFARYIRHISPRRNGPFTTVNCSAIPENLIESELFGYVKGAFTGAQEDRIGKFQAAHTGILFLDEIGDMSLSVQTRLLRAIQEGEITRVGATHTEKVDVQIIGATNKDIDGARKQGGFREDLYQRLAVILINLPPLAERRGDIPLLVQEFLRKFNKKYKRNAVFSQETMAFVQNLPWPGNIRELSRIIDRSVMLAKKDVIDPSDIRLDRLTSDHTNAFGIPEPAEGFSMEHYLSSVRKRLMERALEMADGNQRQAATLLNISSQAVSQYVGKSREAR